MSQAILTGSEREVLDLSAALWNAYLELPVEHPCDRQEFCTALHALQNMILARPGRRQLNAGPAGA